MKIFWHLLKQTIKEIFLSSYNYIYLYLFGASLVLLSCLERRGKGRDLGQFTSKICLGVD